MSSVIPPESRPEPIRDAISKVAYFLGAIVAVGTFLATKGVISAGTLDLVTGYTEGLNGLLEDLTSAGAAIVNGGLLVGGLKVATRHATGESTPSRDPRDWDLTPLMRVDGKPLGGVELPPIDVLPGQDVPPDSPPTMSFGVPSDPNRL